MKRPIALLCLAALLLAVAVLPATVFALLPVVVLLLAPALSLTRFEAARRQRPPLRYSFASLLFRGPPALEFVPVSVSGTGLEEETWREGSEVARTV